MPALDRALDALGSISRRQAQSFSARVSPAGTPANGLPGQLAPGARVFDTVTGVEGVIVACKKTSILVQPANR